MFFDQIVKFFEDLFHEKIYCSSCNREIGADEFYISLCTNKLPKEQVNTLKLHRKKEAIRLCSYCEKTYPAGTFTISNLFHNHIVEKVTPRQVLNIKRRVVC